jgi:hypothetical protein
VGAKHPGDGCVRRASRRRKIGIEKYLLVSIFRANIKSL